MLTCITKIFINVRCNFTFILDVLSETVVIGFVWFCLVLDIVGCSIVTSHIGVGKSERFAWCCVTQSKGGEWHFMKCPNAAVKEITKPFFVLLWRDGDFINIEMKTWQFGLVAYKHGWMCHGWVHSFVCFFFNFKKEK